MKNQINCCSDTCIYMTEKETASNETPISFIGFVDPTIKYNIGKIATTKGRYLLKIWINQLYYENITMITSVLKTYFVFKRF